MNENKIKKASIYYLIGTLFNKGIAFITVPIFARIITVHDYGIVTTYNSWVSIATMFLSLALYMAVRISFLDFEKKTNDFLSTILMFTGLYGISIIFMVCIILFFLPVSLNIGIVVLCLLEALGAALIEEISQYLMMLYRYKFRTVIMIAPNFVSTIISVMLIKCVLKGNLYLGRIIPAALLTFGIGLSLALIFIPKGKIALNKDYLKYALKLSLPLVLHGIALNILSQSDRTMITAIKSAEETGIYGLIYNFSLIATVITTAFEGVWFPFFVDNMKKADYSIINKISVKYIEMMTIAMIGVILVGPEVVKILATEQYWKGIKIIPPIVLANYFIFLYTLYVNVEHYYKKTIMVSFITSIAAVSNIVMNYYFIRKWGYVGAAYSTILAYLLSLSIHAVYARRLNSKVFPLSQIIFPSAIIGIIVCVFYLFIDNFIVRWLIAIGCLAITLLKEKKFIIEILKNKNCISL